jgi:lysophospholipase L1-like esterase
LTDHSQHTAHIQPLAMLRRQLVRMAHPLSPTSKVSRGAASVTGLALAATVLAGIVSAATATTISVGRVLPAASPTASAPSPASGAVEARAAVPASPTVPKAHARTDAVTGPVVVLGDSVAAGTGCDCTPYATLLARGLADRTGQAVSVVNAGADGLTSGGLLDQLGQPAVQRALSTAGVVTVTIGANDFDSGAAGDSACAAVDSCYGSALTELSAHVQTIITQITKLSPPGAKVLVTGYWNVFLDGDMGRAQGGTYVANSDALTRRVNTALQGQTVAAGDRFVDVYGPFENGSLAALNGLLADDGDHPSAAGHALIARLLLAAL